MKNVLEMWDGDTYPILQFQLADGPNIRDTTNTAAWFDVWKGGSYLTRRPGKLTDPKSSGTVECFFRGSETDWAGQGAALTVYPIVLVPHAGNGLLADTVLSNASFDAFGGTSPTQLAQFWQIVGSQTVAVYEVRSNGPKPAAIFGNFQSIYRSAIGGTDQYRQLVTGQHAKAGDYVTFGVWIRAEATVQLTNAPRMVLAFADNASDNTVMNLPLGTYDWTFLYIEHQLQHDQTSLDFRVQTAGSTGTWQLDEACGFIGRYRTVRAEPIRVNVKSRLRSVRTSNQIAGYGSFERDSDGDGLPDGWMKGGAAFTPVLSLDQDPANVAITGRTSLKLVGSGMIGSAQQLKTEIRGAFKSGDVWRGSIQAKTLGSLSGTLPTIRVATGPFDSVASSGTATSIGQTLNSFTTYTTDCTLASDCNQIRYEINLSGFTGTLWLDDAQLKKL